MIDSIQRFMLYLSMDKHILQQEPLWNYFSQTQKDLVLEGQYLTQDIIRDHAFHFKDYSFLIFPFAKTYEGFLKQLFKDVKFISHLDYISDHLRLGKLLSPHLEIRLGERSLYRKVSECGSEALAKRIWQTWKLGRNEIFHYFPHNLKAVSFRAAEQTTEEILEAMREAYKELKLMRVKNRLMQYN